MRTYMKLVIIIFSDMLFYIFSMECAAASVIDFKIKPEINKSNFSTEYGMVKVRMKNILFSRNVTLKTYLHILAS